MRNFLILLVITFYVPFGWGQEDSNTSPADDTIYRIQIRAIIAGDTGLKGMVPHELRDMKSALTQTFDYASYNLSHRIRLSFFGEEETSALLFPEHYLHIIPKGSARGGKAVKCKVELYYLPTENNVETKYYLPRPDLVPDTEDSIFPPGATVEEKGQKREPLLPIVSSAMILTQESWEVIGGILVRVNAKNQLSTHSYSTHSLSSPGSAHALGKEGFLILALKLGAVE